MELFLLVAALIIAVAIIKGRSSRRSMTPEDKACVDAVLAALRQDAATDAHKIAEVFKAHGRTRDDVGQVSLLIKPRLFGVAGSKEERQDMMREVSRAKGLL